MNQGITPPPSNTPGHSKNAGMSTPSYFLVCPVSWQFATRTATKSATKNWESRHPSPYHHPSPLNIDLGILPSDPKRCSNSPPGSPRREAGRPIGIAARADNTQPAIIIPPDRHSAIIDIEDGGGL